jgi:hypothetical protein
MSDRPTESCNEGFRKVDFGQPWEVAHEQRDFHFHRSPKTTS